VDEVDGGGGGGGGGGGEGQGVCLENNLLGKFRTS